MNTRIAEITAETHIVLAILIQMADRTVTTREITLDHQITEIITNLDTRIETE